MADLEENKNKNLMIKYKNHKCLNEILSPNICKCPYYKQMNMWNWPHASGFNQMLKTMINTTLFKIHNINHLHTIQEIKLLALFFVLTIFLASLTVVTSTLIYC